MEGISQLVSESLARNGVQPSFDHLRLEWSRWFRCHSSFDVLLAGAKAGIFALAEEMAPGVDGNRRLLAVFQISQTDDLGMALGRLFLTGNPLRERLESETCFVRYAVIEDAEERIAAFDIFQRWMQGAAEAASGIASQKEPCGAGALARDSVPSSSSAWGVGCKEAQDRELPERFFGSAPPPSGI